MHVFLLEKKKKSPYSQISKITIIQKTRYPKSMILVPCCIWEDARIWAYWNYSLDVCLNYLGLVSSVSQVSSCTKREGSSLRFQPHSSAPSSPLTGFSIQKDEIFSASFSCGLCSYKWLGQHSGGAAKDKRNEKNNINFSHPHFRIFFPVSFLASVTTLQKYLWSGSLSFPVVFSEYNKPPREFRTASKVAWHTSSLCRTG